jgi:two-component system sensor histidine kinase HydH
MSAEPRLPGPQRLRAFASSLVTRYSLLLVASAVLPMLVVAMVYDRYTRNLLRELTGEQLNAQLAATASRLDSFLEARRRQLETLARYPTSGAAGARGTTEDELRALVRLEADEPDLYGILFFSDDGNLDHAVAGQAASGPPYWAEFPFDLATLPRHSLGEIEVVGPVAPRDGQAGWFLMRDAFRGGGTVALHVRLASLTELLGATSLAGVIEPVLSTPAGYFDVVGRPAVVHSQLVVGPELLPGWRPCLVVDPDELLRPFQAARYTLLAACLAAIGAVAWVLGRMARRLKRRVQVLEEGAEKLSAGELSYRFVDPTGDEIGSLAFAFNRMGERLQDLIERTVRMERLAALGRFSTGIAHEVRNPLATLKTTVQALERLERDPQRSSLLRDMSSEIDRMARTVGELLAFGRPRAPEVTDVRVRDVARRVEALVATEATERGLQFGLQGDFEVTALADFDHLVQIALNLTLNALQATPRGGLVTLRCYRMGDRVAVEVRDTGAGIAPERLREVFEPFFTTKPGGTGLGLSISRQLAELNGGSLGLESTPGQGTTARLLLTHGGDGDAERPHHR